MLERRFIEDALNLAETGCRVAGIGAAGLVVPGLNELLHRRSRKIEVVGGIPGENFDIAKNLKCAPASLNALGVSDEILSTCTEFSQHLRAVRKSTDLHVIASQRPPESGQFVALPHFVSIQEAAPGLMTWDTANGDGRSCHRYVPIPAVIEDGVSGN